MALGAGCHREPPPRADWIIDSQLVFLDDDLSHAHAPLSAQQFRLFFPFVAGDLYGAATTGDFLQPQLAADYHFRVDLNHAHRALLASLEPTNFSVSYLHMEPAAARVARLAPLMLQPDGIEQVGRLDWFDPEAHRTLLLLYLDRPATIVGRAQASGRPLRYDIHAAAAGYVWVGLESHGDEDIYTVVPRPARLLLAARVQ